MNKLDNFVRGLCMIGELACITALAGIAYKRNNECYKAELDAINAKFAHEICKIDNMIKDDEIKSLKEELTKLKGEES